MWAGLGRPRSEYILSGTPLSTLASIEVLSIHNHQPLLRGQISNTFCADRGGIKEVVFQVNCRSVLWFKLITMSNVQDIYAPYWTFWTISEIILLIAKFILDVSVSAQKLRANQPWLLKETPKSTSSLKRPLSQYCLSKEAPKSTSSHVYESQWTVKCKNAIKAI